MLIVETVKSRGHTIADATRPKFVSRTNAGSNNAITAGREDRGCGGWVWGNGREEKGESGEGGKAGEKRGWKGEKKRVEGGREVGGRRKRRGWKGKRKEGGKGNEEMVERGIERIERGKRGDGGKGKRNGRKGKGG